MPWNKTMPDKYTETYTIKNTYGLHIRPSTAFSKLAKSFDGTVKVCCNGKEVNGKSTMSLLTLGAIQGDQLTLTVEGEGGDKLLLAFEKLINDYFGLEEEKNKR